MNIEIIQPNEWQDWTSIPNSCIFEPNIDESAFRLYCYLKSRPNGWQYNIKHLCTVFKWGRDKAYKKMQLLNKTGWVQIEQIKHNGKFTNDIKLKVLIKPFNEISVYGEKPHTETTVYGKIININNTDKINNIDFIKNTLSQTTQKDKKDERDFKNFFEFRKYLLDNFSGTFKTTLQKGNPLDLLPTTVVGLSVSGFLHNFYNGKDFESDEAKVLWSYLYQNKNKVIEVCKQIKQGGNICENT